MAPLSGISHLGRLCTVFPFSTLSEWWNPSKSTSKLSLIYQLADQALVQNKDDAAGNYHYVTLVDNNTLELKSLKDSKQSRFEQVRDRSKINITTS